MAFNPFRTFRKYQKTLMAALAIGVMFIFVFTYSGAGGRWDQIFVELGRRMHLYKGANDADVAKVYGSNVTEQELIDLAVKRSGALTLWLEANKAAQQEIQGQMQEQRQKSLSQQLGNFADSKEAQAESQRLLGELIRVYQASQYPSVMFSTLNTDGLLDFIVWRKQADKLGITLTEKDVAKLFRKETANSSTIELDLMIDSLRRNQPYNRLSSEELRTALGDEFRVRLAQEAVLGGNGMGESIQSTVAPVTPYEFWDYFREQRTRLKVDVLPIPVDAFLSTITAKPSDDQLRSLFNDHKDQVPDPEKKQPGFKEPHRVAVEWLTMNDKNPIYGELLTLNSLFPTPNPLVNAFQAVGQYSVAWKDYDENRSAARYQAPDPSAANLTLAYYFGLTSPEQAATLVGRMAGPQSPLMTLASVTAMGATPERTALLERDAANRKKAFTEVKAQLAISAWNPIGGALAAYPLLAAFQLDMDRSFHQGYYYPFAVVRNEIEAGMREKQIAEMKKQTLAEFEKDLSGLKSKTEADAPQALAEVLDKHALYRLTAESLAQLRKDGLPDATAEKLAKIKDMFFRSKEGLQKELAKVLTADELKGQDEKIVKAAQRLEPVDIGKSEKPDDKYHIQSDPGLKRLAPTDAKPGDYAFADIFFQDKLRLNEISQKDFGSGDNKQTYLWWKTQDLPAQKLSFEAARPKVEAAWRLIQARKKAEQVAKSLEKKYPADADHNLRDELLKLKNEYPHGQWQDVFDLPEKTIQPLIGYEKERTLGISLLQWNESIQDSGQRAHWGPTVPPKDKILYPPTDFAADLVKNLLKVGDAMVIQDRPAKNYYLVVLLDRTPPSQRDFSDEVSRDWHGQGLWDYMTQERLEAIRKQIVQELRQEAGLVDADGNRKYSESEELNSKIRSWARR